MSRPLATFFVMVLVVLLFPSLGYGQAGGTYKVAICSFPDGRPAASHGWRIVKPHPGAGYDVSCADGSNSLGVYLTADHWYPRGFDTGIELKMPDGVRIVAFSARHAQWADMEPASWALMAGYWAQPTSTGIWTPHDVCWGKCFFPFSNWRVINSKADLRSIGLGIACDQYMPGDCPPGHAAGTRISGIELTLRDDHAPRFVTTPRGTLLDPTYTARFREIRFDAADRGGGLKSSVLEVDGAPVLTQPFTAASEGCMPPYDRLAPCPLSGSQTLTLDTGSLTPGKHTGRLVAYDASGQKVEHPFQFVVYDPSRPGDSCVEDAVLTLRFNRKLVRFGSTVLRFSATGPIPLPKAVLLLDEDAGSSIVGVARWRSGRYVARLPLERPMLVRVAASIDGRSFLCSPVARIRIRAGIQLRVGPRTASNGESIRFRGRLLGGSTAARRTVEIQARAKGGPNQWTLVRALRTDARGRFRMTYTFRRTYGAVTYLFRAVRRKEPGFLYATGWSRVRSVHVRGPRT